MYCEDPAQDKIANVETGIEAWWILKKFYERRDAPMKLMLKQQLENMRQDKNEDIESWATRLRHVAKESHACGSTIDESDLAHKLLLRLDPRFASIQQTVFALASAGQIQLEFETMYEVLITQQSLLSLKNTPIPREQVTTQAMAARGDHKKGRDQSKVVCYNCGQTGHYKSACRNEKASTEKIEEAKARVGDRSKRKVRKGQSQDTTGGDHFPIAGVARVCGIAKHSATTTVIFDTGASHHFIPHATSFEELFPDSEPVSLASGMMPAEGRGKAKIRVRSGQGNVSFELKDALYVPSASYCLISISRLLKSGSIVTFNKSDHSMKISDATGRSRLTVPLTDDLWSVSLDLPVGAAASKPDWSIWHARVGHRPIAAMKKTMEVSRGFKVEGPEPEELCAPCELGKGTRGSHPLSTNPQPTAAFELCHSDIAGPISPIGLNGERYMFLVTDEYTGYRWVWATARKDQSPQVIRNIIQIAHQHGSRLRVLRTDEDSVFIGEPAKTIYTEAGVNHETSATYTPQQNGLAERSNRTILDTARTLLAAGPIDSRIWPSAVCTAAYLLNRTWKKSVNVTPFEMLQVNSQA